MPTSLKSLWRAGNPRRSIVYYRLLVEWSRIAFRTYLTQGRRGGSTIVSFSAFVPRTALTIFFHSKDRERRHFPFHARSMPQCGAPRATGPRRNVNSIQGSLRLPSGLQPFAQPLMGGRFCTLRIWVLPASWPGTKPTSEGF